MKVYVASSWRNNRQPLVVERLRAAGHEVYDFRNPAPGVNGFAWSEIDRGWQGWTTLEFTDALDHPIAVAGFRRDYDAMRWADVVVLLQPCGRSASLEAGWAVGAGKPVVVLLAEGQEPELMLKLAQEVDGGGFVFTAEELVEQLDLIERHRDADEGVLPDERRPAPEPVELDDDAGPREHVAAIDEVEEDRTAEDLRQILTRLVNRLPEGEDLIDVLCRDDDDRASASALLDEVLEAL